MPERSADLAGQVLGVPRLVPGAHAGFELLDDGVGDPGVGVLFGHCLFLHLTSRAGRETKGQGDKADGHGPTRERSERSGRALSGGRTCHCRGT